MVLTYCSAQNALRSTPADEVMQGSCQNKWSCGLLFFDLGYIETLRDENTPYRNSSALFSNFHPLSYASLISTSLSPFPFPLHCFVLHLPFTRNQQAQPPLRLQKPASLSASATLRQRLVLHASHLFTGHTRSQTCTHSDTAAAMQFTHCYLKSKEACGFCLTAAVRIDVN